MMKSLSGRVPTNSCNSAEVPCVHFMCQCVNVQKPCEDSLLTGALRLERTLHAAPVDVASGAAACKWKSEGSWSGWGGAATCEDLRDLDGARTNSIKKLARADVGQPPSQCKWIQIE